LKLTLFVKRHSNRINLRKRTNPKIKETKILSEIKLMGIFK
jgi:hypothetical protein